MRSKMLLQQQKLFLFFLQNIPVGLFIYIIVRANVEEEIPPQKLRYPDETNHNLVFNVWSMTNLVPSGLLGYNGKIQEVLRS